MNKKIIVLTFNLVFYSCVMPYDKNKINYIYDNIKEELNSKLPDNSSSGDAQDSQINPVKITDFSINGCFDCTYFISLVEDELTTITVELSETYFEALINNIKDQNFEGINVIPFIVFEPENAIITPANSVQQAIVSKAQVDDAVYKTIGPIKGGTLDEVELNNVKNEIKNDINELSEITYKITDPRTNASKTYRIIFKVKELKSLNEYKLESNNFNMTKLDSNIKYAKDGRLIIIDYSFSIADTELSLAVWSEVYNWAIKNSYTFINSGLNSKHANMQETQAVVNISFYDAIVWTNALTEYYNLINTNKEALTYVYLNDNVPLKNARNTGLYEVNINATGFRLPDIEEWELAARYLGEKKPEDATQFDYIQSTNANGKTYYWAPEFKLLDASIYYSFESLSEIAWFKKEFSKSIKEHVKANILGLYDMLGNVQEFCNKKIYTQSGIIRPTNKYYIKGGSYLSDEEGLQIGISKLEKIIISNDQTGFRLAKTNK